MENPTTPPRYQPMPSSFTNTERWKGTGKKFGSSTVAELVTNEKGIIKNRFLRSPSLQIDIREAYKKPDSNHCNQDDVQAIREVLASAIGRHLLGVQMPKVEFVPPEWTTEDSFFDKRDIPPRRCISHAIPGALIDKSLPGGKQPLEGTIPPIPGQALRCREALGSPDTSVREAAKKALPELGRAIVLDALLGARDRCNPGNAMYSQYDKHWYSLDYSHSFQTLEGDGIGEPHTPYVQENPLPQSIFECRERIEETIRFEQYYEYYLPGIHEAIQKNPGPFLRAIGNVDSIQDDEINQYADAIFREGNPTPADPENAPEPLDLNAFNEIREKTKTFLKYRRDNIHDIMDKWLEKMNIDITIPERIIQRYGMECKNSNDAAWTKASGKHSFTLQTNPTVDSNGWINISQRGKQFRLGVTTLEDSLEKQLGVYSIDELGSNLQASHLKIRYENGNMQCSLEPKQQERDCCLLL